MALKTRSVSTLYDEKGRAQKIAKAGECFLPKTGFTLDIGVMPSDSEMSQKVEGNLMGYCGQFGTDPVESCDLPIRGKWLAQVAQDRITGWNYYDHKQPIAQLWSVGKDEQEIYLSLLGSGSTGEQERATNKKISYWNGLDAAGLIIRHAGQATPETLADAYWRIDDHIGGFVSQARLIQPSDLFYVAASVTNTANDLLPDLKVGVSMQSHGALLVS